MEMLPSHQIPFSASSSQASLPTSYSLPSLPSFAGHYGTPATSSQSFVHSALHDQHAHFHTQPAANASADPNAPEVFRQNMQIVLEHVSRVQAMARSALSGIDNAYHPGASTAHTEADIASVKQALHDLSSFMRHTGVGALPLIGLDSAVPPSEEKMSAETGTAIQALYERLQRTQESAGVVANLLAGAR